MSNTTLKVAGELYDSLVNGPGLRYVLFLQGCTMHCEGCQNQHTWNLNGGTEVSIDEIMSHIKKSCLIDGVTLSGGDPVEQYEKVTELCQAIKAYDANLSILMYTGRTYEELMSLTNIDKLFSYVDYIIDGKFEINNMKCAMKYTGSSNQKIWKKDQNNMFIQTNF